MLLETVSGIIAAVLGLCGAIAAFLLILRQKAIKSWPTAQGEPRDVLVNPESSMVKAIAIFAGSAVAFVVGILLLVSSLT